MNKYLNASQEKTIGCFPVRCGHDVSRLNFNITPSLNTVCSWKLFHGDVSIGLHGRMEQPVERM